MTSAIAQLADWVATLDWESIAENARTDGQRQLLDCLGVIVAGSRANEIRSLARMEAEERGESSLIGHRLRASPEAAALVNATAGVWHDFDSGQRFSGSHPAIHVVPAALAVAESTGASGRATLSAIIAGCEVAARVGVAAGRLRPGMSPHGGWAVIGAAAAVAKLWQDDRDAIAAAMDIASSLTVLSSTSVHSAGANVRHLQAGFGAKHGVLAARAVADGVAGDRGGVPAVVGGFLTPAFNARRLVLQLGETWEFTRGYYKPYPIARFGHAAIDALLAIRDRTGPRNDVVSVRVRTYSAAAALTNPAPPSPLAARFSLPYSLAVAWRFGELPLEAFEGNALADPDLLQFARTVGIEEDRDYSALAPEFRPAEVTVYFAENRSITVERLNARGEADDSERDLWLAAKFLLLVTPSFGQANAASALAAINALADAPNVREWLATFQDLLLRS